MSNQIVMEETLEEALDRIFPHGAPIEPIAAAPSATSEAAPLPDAPNSESSLPSGDSAQRAWGHYQSALEAQRAGDWARYGEELQRLGAVLDQMAAPAR